MRAGSAPSARAPESCASLPSLAISDWTCAASASGVIEQYPGTTKPPPGAVMPDAAFRRAYYFASYRYVRYLI
jgi:hypothetical protein